MSKTLYRATGGVIEQSSKQPTHGPMLFTWLKMSDPPQGGDFLINGWDWDMAKLKKSRNGTTWTEGTHYELVGTWDGTALTLTGDPVETPIPASERTELTPDCDQNSLEVVKAEIVDVLSRIDIGHYSIGVNGTNGDCVIELTALIDSPDLRTAIQPYMDHLRVRFLLNKLA